MSNRRVKGASEDIQGRYNNCFMFVLCFKVIIPTHGKSDEQERKKLFSRFAYVFALYFSCGVAEEKESKRKCRGYIVDRNMQHETEKREK